MAGKRAASASPVKRDYLPPLLLGIRTEGMGRGWEAAKALFNHRKADDALKGVLPFADERLAIALFVAGGLLAFVFSVLTNLMMLYVLQLEASMYQELVTEKVQVPDLSAMLPIALVNFIVYVPFMVGVNVLLERLAFAMARATGGKGALGGQMLLSSVVWLAIALTTAANLVAPIGIFWLLSLAFIGVVGVLYLMAYMVSRAYSMVHGIGFLHALAINVFVIILRIVLWSYGTQTAVAALGASLEGV